MRVISRTNGLGSSGSVVGIERASGSIMSSVGFGAGMAGMGTECVEQLLVLLPL